MNDDEPVIIDSARRHGIGDDDILHAYRNAIRSEPFDDGFVMVIGPDRAVRLLEIGVVRDVRTTIVHAMKARKRYLR